MGQKPLTIEEATNAGPGSPESVDPAYLAWKADKIKKSVEYADAHPDDFRTHDQVFSRFLKNDSERSSL